MKKVAAGVVELHPDEAEMVHDWYAQVAVQVQEATGPNWRSELKNRPQWIMIKDAKRRLQSGSLTITWEQWATYYGAHLGHPNLQKFKFED